MNWYKRANPISEAPEYVKNYYDVGHVDWSECRRSNGYDNYNDREVSETYIWEIALQDGVWKFNILPAFGNNKGENHSQSFNTPYDNIIAKGRLEYNNHDPDGIASLDIDENYFLNTNTKIWDARVKKIEKMLDNEIFKLKGKVPRLVIL